MMLRANVIKNAQLASRALSRRTFSGAAAAQRVNETESFQDRGGSRVENRFRDPETQKVYRQEHVAEASSASESNEKEQVAPGSNANAELPQEVKELFTTLRDESLQRIHEFAPAHLFSLIWAFSTAGLLDEQLYSRALKTVHEMAKKRDVDSAAAHAAKNLPAPPAMPVSHLQPCILHENEHIMVLFKPPYWIVNPEGANARVGQQEESVADEEEDANGEMPSTRIQSFVRRHLSNLPISHDADSSFGLAHRLDCQTSGGVLLAKTYLGFYHLRMQFAAHKVDKEYVSLCHGWVNPELRRMNQRIRIRKADVEENLLRERKNRTIKIYKIHVKIVERLHHQVADPNGKKRLNEAGESVPESASVCSVAADGKPALTELRSLARFQAADGAKYTLVALKLHTGRTHQIRVHMAHAKHPLVSDRVYNSDKYSTDRRWCDRNFLHTYRLGYNNVEGNVESVDIPLPKDLESALSKLVPADDASKVMMKDLMDGVNLKPFATYD